MNAAEFEKFCLRPAKEMRGIIKMQPGILDFGEFGQSVIPDIKVNKNFAVRPYIKVKEKFCGIMAK